MSRKFSVDKDFISKINSVSMFSLFSARKVKLSPFFIFFLANLLCITTQYSKERCYEQSIVRQKVMNTENKYQNFANIFLYK